MSKADWAYTNSNPYSATGNANPIVNPGGNFNQTRGIVGLQAGCDRAIADSLLVGIEVSGITNPMNEHNPRPGFFPDPNAFPRETSVITTNIQSVLALTGRVGLAVAPDWLLYAKGGVAAARIETRGTVTPAFDPAIFDFQTMAWHVGWIAGAGVEYRLFRNVTVGLEYDYYRFGKVTHSGTVAAQDFINGIPTPSNPVNHRVGADLHTVVGRINFGLDWLGGTESGAYGAYAAYVKAPPQAQTAGNFTAFVNSETKYSNWTGTRGTNVFAPDRGAGSQVYSPTTVGIDYVLPEAFRLETRLRSGYVYSAHNTAGQIARYEGPVDTQAAFNLTLLNFESVRPLLGLSLNLPTGNTYLPNNQRFARMDPDLVDAGSYGVGFNVNATAGFIVGLNENTAASLSAGYTWQGDFTKEGINQAQVANIAPPPAFLVVNTFDIRQRVSPGQTYTVNGNISSTLGSLVLAASFAYMGSSQASIDGIATGRAGAKFTSNASANYQFDERTALALNVSWNFAEKNEIPNALGGFVLEPRNSNSHVVIGSVEPSYLVTERLKLAANYSFLYRDHNFYDIFQSQFIPAKQKHSAGGSAVFALTEATTMTLRGSHAWVQQEDGPFLVTGNIPPGTLLSQPPVLRYHAWTASIGANVRF